MWKNRIYIIQVLMSWEIGREWENEIRLQNPLELNSEPKSV